MASYQEIQAGIDKAKATFAGIQAQAKNMGVATTTPTLNSANLSPAPDLSKSLAYVPPSPIPGLPLTPMQQGVKAPAGQEYDASGNLVPITSTNANGVPTTSPTTPLSPTQQQAQDITTRLQTLNDQTVGESAYRTEQETAQGLPQLNTQANDLNSQLKAIQNEAAQIPLQLEKEAAGRGITTAILGRQQTSRLRDNAIQALSVSTLLSAVQGNIALASANVDKLVAAKYDPIREQIKAATANLDLILKSPKYTEEEKAKAQAQKDIQDKKARDIEQHQEDAKTIASWAAAAIANGATTLQAQEIMKLANSDTPDLQTAFQLYAPYAKDPVAAQKALDEHLNSVADRDYKVSQTAVNKANADKIKAGTDDVPTIKTINGVDMQWDPKAKEWKTIGAGPNATTQKSSDQLTFLKNTAADALTVAGAAGRSGARRTAESWLVGSTDYTKLEALTNTLKVNVLTLMTDPNIKKFFGPQMSNADVTLMTSAGTTLNPELSSPDMMTTEITRLNNLFDRMQSALNTGGSSGGSQVMIGPDNIEYNVPSDQVDAFIKAGGKKK